MALILIRNTIITDIWESHDDGTFGHTNFPNVGDSGGVNCRVGYRVRSVTIPNGATIVSAHILAHWVDSRSLQLDAAAIDADDGGTYANQTEWNAATRTAFVDHDVTTTASHRAILADVKAGLQIVVNRSGWVSGNDVEFDIGGDGDGSAKGRLYANGTSGSSASTFFAEYTTDPSSSGVTRRIPMVIGA